MKTLLKPFNNLQKDIVKALWIALIIGLVGMIISSLLGGKYQSFHIIDITTGWAKIMFDGFSDVTLGSLCALLGMYGVKITDKLKDNSTGDK